MIGTIITAISYADKAVSWLNNGNLERYGSAIRTVGDMGKKIVGHLETTKKAASASKILTTSGTAEGIGSQLSNISGMVQQLTASSSKILGGITSLSWANLAVSGINLGVTAVGMVVISKKINALSQEVQQMNGKLDIIISEMEAIKSGVNELKENEIRKLYKDIDEQIAYMQHCINKLNSGNYTDYVVGETEKTLIKASKSLNDLLTRYNDSNCRISLGLDIIMAHFYAFVSLLKTYMSTVYLHKSKKNYCLEYDNILRNFCSKSMIESIQNVYRQSSSSFISPQDLALITSVYKNIMVEQISEIKSQRQIIELVNYNDYKRINEKLQESNESGELAYIQYN